MTLAMGTGRAVANSRRTAGDDIVYRLATTVAERREAFRLAYHTFVRKRSIKPNTLQMRVTPWHLLDTTAMFVGMRRDHLVGTATLIGDGELKLPLDTSHAAAIDALRSSGHRPAEVSCLAIQDIPPAQFLPFFLRLTRVMAQFAHRGGYDMLVCAAAPTQIRFYAQSMGFEPLPDSLQTEGTDAPSVACCLDFERIERERPECHAQYFGQPIPERELVPEPLTPSELATLRPIAEQAGLCAPVPV